jgi:hypothetical protein
VTALVRVQVRIRILFVLSFCKTSQVSCILSSLLFRQVATEMEKKEAEDIVVVDIAEVRALNDCDHGTS